MQGFFRSSTTIVAIGVWRQREDPPIRRMETLPMAELDRLINLPLERSDGRLRDGEQKLAPHACAHDHPSSCHEHS
jgi:hypothetical protein